MHMILLRFCRLNIWNYWSWDLQYCSFKTAFRKNHLLLNKNIKELKHFMFRISFLAFRIQNSFINKWILENVCVGVNAHTHARARSFCLTYFIQKKTSMKPRQPLLKLITQIIKACLSLQKCQWSGDSLREEIRRLTLYKQQVAIKVTSNISCTATITVAWHGWEDTIQITF